ncbi:MBL fold metallo-hydrolase [Candidatus Woesearchaeota archaeon]|nr:MAG: MBL fold metallo-hydrolase [Candidatus Woesearchaeota archaeon]
MQLIFHGAAREVGRSCVEVASEKRFLFDAGIKITAEQPEHPTHIDDLRGIAGVFLSHGHLDHCGALPLLDHTGLRCPIFCTSATKAITRILLKDALKIERIKHHHPAYDKNDVFKALDSVQKVRYGQKNYLEGIEFAFQDAGHIPGSASIMVEVEGKRILYTGDINTTQTMLLKGAFVNFPKINTLICESTYGEKDHPERKKEEKAFLSKVKEISDTGSVILPVFAVGRAQEVMMMLAKKDFSVPIYMDGMAKSVTELFEQEPGFIRDVSLLQKSAEKVEFIESRDEREEALKKKGIFLTTSGMLSGGPVIKYLTELGDNPNNGILLTGYQTEDSNGRLLLEEGRVIIDNKLIKINSQVKQFDFSAHAGMRELKELVRKIMPEHAIFVHGDKSATLSMAKFAESLGIKACAPKTDEILEV